MSQVEANKAIIQRHFEDNHKNEEYLMKIVAPE